ncbi:3-dehydroquinate synthase [Candidatus Woesearchaeota archaeon]|nr:3-dehydroquinate synthase [Candidatus Woesearchaeota archaeon]
MKLLKCQDTEVFVGRSLLSMLHKLFSIHSFSKVCVITDENAAVFLPKIRKCVRKNLFTFVLPQGEKCKDIRTVMQLWDFLVRKRFDRSSLIINLGGGVVTDLGGFVASTYMRGINFVNIPTTLLAMVDASVGGKNGINYAGSKNIIGTINAPCAVVMDADVLKFLPARVFLAGFAEVIKHGLVFDRKYFSFVTSKHPLKFSGRELEEIIAGSVRIKSLIVSSDSKETGIRQFLNFGHTIGHALEVLCKLPHGEAVSIGMVAEAKLSQLLGIVDEEIVARVRASLINAGLPVKPPKCSSVKVWNAMQMDKKVSSGIINWCLLQSIGRAVYNIHAPKNKVIQALRHIL